MLHTTASSRTALELPQPTANPPAGYLYFSEAAGVLGLVPRVDMIDIPYYLKYTREVGMSFDTIWSEVGNRVAREKRTVL
jgi:hypothetical protein